MKKWSEQAWEQTLPIYNRTLELPFLKELTDGSLDRAKFEHYIQQDALYLKDYGHVLFRISERLDKAPYKELFKHFSDNAVVCEQALHEVLIKKFNIPKQDKKSVACRSYTSFLLDCIENRTVEEALAAVLPCFWVYNKVGKYIYKHQSQRENPYQTWIDTYAGDEFDIEVQRCINVCDEYAAANPSLQTAMNNAFAFAVQAEHDFWDGAYRLKMDSLKYKCVLTIAGSDPSGGAGIQADLKTMSACGCYGASAIVAVVDENTVGVTDVHPIPVNFVVGQIKSVLNDIGADAIKIGMLHSSELIHAVKETLRPYNIQNIVLDPVMVATSGDPLLQTEAINTLKNELIPYVRVITPNIPETEILLGKKITSQSELRSCAKELSQNDSVSVLLKAGHLTEDELIDIFYNAETHEFIELKSQRLYTRNTHGTGCTLSSAVASFLARGFSLNDAVRQAKDYINAAITAGSDYEIGHGHGPVHHFWNFWK